MDSFRQDYALYVKSGVPGNEVVERLDAYWDGAEEPTVGDPDPDASGLSDTAVGNLIMEVSRSFEAPPLPWAIESGIEDLSIANKVFDPGIGDEVAPDTAMWKDSLHVRPASSVVTAIRRLISMIDSRHPEITRRVATGPKGHGQSDEDVMNELSEELGIILRHLEWAAAHRANPQVTMINRQG